MAVSCASSHPFKVGAANTPPVCALHKLRWGSDPLFQGAGGETSPGGGHGAGVAGGSGEGGSDAPKTSGGGMKRTLTQGTSLTSAGGGGASEGDPDAAGVGVRASDEGPGCSGRSRDESGGVCPKELKSALQCMAEKDVLEFGADGCGRVADRPTLSKSESETSDAGGWGFYKDCEGTPGDSAYRLDATILQNRETPDYVLEDSLANQALWHSTAGTRPVQPPHERRRYEQMWQEQMERSQAVSDSDKKPKPRSLSASQQQRASRENLPAKCGDAQLILRASSPFGTSVTKSWRCDCCGELTSIMVRIPKYQIVKKGSKSYAEYLVVARLGAVTFGLWRRYSHFHQLFEKIAKNFDRDDYQNTLWSWRCLRRRQRWFRCLDKDYLALKCFLLERFLHDAVFESSNSNLFMDFFEIALPEALGDATAPLPPQ